MVLWVASAISSASFARVHSHGCFRAGGGLAWRVRDGLSMSAQGATSDFLHAASPPLVGTAWWSHVPRGQENGDPASGGTQPQPSHSPRVKASHRCKRVKKQTPRPEGKSNKSPLPRPVDRTPWGLLLYCLPRGAHVTRCVQLAFLHLPLPFFFWPQVTLLFGRGNREVSGN